MGAQRCAQSTSMIQIMKTNGPKHCTGGTKLYSPGTK